jgi:hypothetical protein
MQQLRPTPSEEAWEGLPYLDRIWSCRQLPWRERSRLLEMHRAGLLAEGELTLTTLRALDSSGLDGAAMRTVLVDFWEVLSKRTYQDPQWRQRAWVWKSRKLLELLHRHVREAGWLLPTR